MGTGNQLARMDLKRDTHAWWSAHGVLQKRNKQESLHDSQLSVKIKGRFGET